MRKLLINLVIGLIYPIFFFLSPIWGWRKNWIYLNLYQDLEEGGEGKENWFQFVYYQLWYLFYKKRQTK